MLVRGIIAAAAALCCFHSDARVAEPNGVRFTYVRITDQRIAEREAAGGEVDTDRSAFSVRLLVDGKLIAGVTSYGNIKYAEVRDDLGNDLRPTRKYTLERNSKFQPTNRIGFSMDMLETRKLEDALMDRINKEAPRGIRLDLDLRSPPRNATKISALKGDFQVNKGGEERQIIVAGLKTLAPKPIADPDLKAAGLALTVLPPEEDEDEEEPTFRVQFTGPLHVITRMSLINEAGESIESEQNGTMTMPSRNGHVTRFYLRQPLDDKARLSLRMLVGQDVVTIPFHLENIPLP